MTGKAIAPDTIRCSLCARTLKRPKTYDKAPPHKCPHGERCNKWAPECLICVAVVESAPEVTDPPCIFCNRQAGLRRPNGHGINEHEIRGGCSACGYGIRRGMGHGDPALLEEIRATTVDVWSTK